MALAQLDPFGPIEFGNHAFDRIRERRPMSVAEARGEIRAGILLGRVRQERGRLLVLTACGRFGYLIEHSRGGAIKVATLIPVVVTVDRSGPPLRAGLSPVR